MGIARVLSFARSLVNGVKVSDVKLDKGGGDNITAQHFADAGDDSYPLPTDYANINKDTGTGRDTANGYHDPINTPKSLIGEKRIYARDANGIEVVEVWLKNDGTAVTENANATFEVNISGAISGTNGNGSFVLQANGDFVVNGVTIFANGYMDVPESLVLNSRQLHDHRHSQGNDSNGDAEVDTDGNL